MGKIIRRLYAAAAVAVALALVSCNRFDEPEVNLVSGSGAFSLTAQTEPQTRAGLSGNDASGYRVVWEKGDDIFVYAPASGGDNTVGTVSVSGGYGTATASFSATKPVDPAAVIWSPASLGTATENLIWPAVQTYTAEGVAGGIPMICTGIESGEGSQNLKFANLGGILRFTLKGTEAEVITGIEISSLTPMSGTFEVDSDNYPAAKLTGSALASDATVKLVVPSVSLTAEGVQFCISLVPGSYEGVEVRFSLAGHDSVIKRLGTAMVISRSRITPATVNLTGVSSMAAGKLVRVEAERNVKASDIISNVLDLAGTQSALVRTLLSAKVPNPVHLARLIYCTKDPSGALVEASGTVAYQYKTGSKLKYSRLVSIQHGTCDIADAPSYGSGIPSEMLPVCVADAKNPVYFIAAMADYLGYGASRTADLQHPYMHTGLTGSACADMITAAEEYVAAQKLNLTGDGIDLLGYSQGGAATLQTLLELESRGIADSRINEVWAGAGPYDLIGFIDYFKAGGNAYGKSGFVPFTFRGICYGDRLNLDWHNLYNPVLVGNLDLESVFSSYQLSGWHGILGSDIAAVLNPDFYMADYNGNADILAMVSALRSNSVTSRPQPRNVGKIRLYHSRTDDTVPFACSEALTAAWPGLSAVNELNTQNNHGKAGVEFMLIYCGMGDFVSFL